MKRSLLTVAILAAFSLVTTSSRAQSLKDLFSKEGISKVVNAVTGHTDVVNMVGTWKYTSSAVEFESDNLLMKAGGSAAATVAESKMNEQLSKIGITQGQMSFTFNADSTFVSTVGKKVVKGTYSYDAHAKQITLKILKLLNMHAKMNYSSDSMDLLFNSDKLLRLLVFFGSKSSSTALKAVSAIGDKYDGMLLGFQLHK